MDNFNNEIPKHRKKVKKSSKKSTHKHNYERVSYREMFRFGSTARLEDGRYWIEVQKHCTICNKTKEFTVFLKREEYLKLPIHN